MGGKPMDPRESTIMSNRPICSQCKLHKDEDLKKYPEMQDLCNMCQVFQDSLFSTIDKRAKVLQNTANNLAEHIK